MSFTSYAQRMKNFKVEHSITATGTTRTRGARSIEDKHAGPAEIACTRIDFGDRGWHRSPAAIAALPSSLAWQQDQRRRPQFRVTAGRVSQIRKELAESWNKFTGGSEANAA